MSYSFMVGRKGLEPSHLAAREPKSRVSTNSTTGPFIFELLCNSNKNTILNIIIMKIWGERWDSNPRHQAPQACALTN